MKIEIRRHKGFTLVELAIVMTIIGLLVGGILKGQEMVANARVNATVSQIQAYRAALIAFRDAYSALPGDMPNANSRIPNCNIGCNTVISGWGRAGDGAIGIGDWNGSPQTFGGVTQGPVIGPDVGFETLNFWTHLLMAGLIGGVTEDGIRAAIPFEFGLTNPASPLGGGFQVGSADGLSFYSVPPDGSVAIANRRVIAVLVNRPQSQIQPAFDPFTNILRPVVAEQIDRKMDDAMPGTGEVRAGGGATAAGGTGCYVTGTAVYNSTGGRVSCKMFFTLD